MMTLKMTDQNNDSIEDFSAINRLEEEFIRREEEVSRDLKSRNRIRNARGAVKKAIETLLILVGLGLFAVLIAFAIRLVIYQPLG
ncbi:MAG: hypothetical protein CML41_00140 [Rhodobacteraceae bacterium]|nr:hypothetical protein [Paracoccaceae bacterium]